MPSRENEIRRAIEILDGDTFEKFSRILVRRDKFPGLRPTSQSHDKGEDSYTEETSLIMHNGKHISLGVSKTDELSKIKEDCDKRIGQNIDIWIFVTSGLVRRDRGKVWKDEIKDQYGWDLEIYDIEWLVDTSTHPNYESLVEDYLHIPPPNGDYIQDIGSQFLRRTQLSLVNISREILGISGPIYRNEILEIEQKLQERNLVLVTGEAGTGKSGIGASLAYTRIQNNSFILFLDARRMTELRTEKDFSDFLHLKGPVVEAISRFTNHSRLTLIVDQLDNVAGLLAANLLVDLTSECVNNKNIEIVIISRDFDVKGNKRTLEKDFEDKGFQIVESKKIEEKDVLTILTQLGVEESPEVIRLAQNLLNLKIIAKIRHEQPDFNFSTIMDESTLWDTYLDVLVQEESINYGSNKGRKIVDAAVDLACDSLRRNQRIFSLGFNLSVEQERLMSWGILREESPGQYRFQHEKMQDYFYALYATRQQFMPSKVFEELGVRNAKNVFSFMNSLYERDSPAQHVKFFKEVMYAKQ